MTPAQSRGAAWRSGKALGMGEGETLIRQDVIGVAAVHVVAVEEGGLAKVFSAAQAEGATAAGPVYPRDTDSRPDFETFNLGAQFLHGPDYLVTGDQGRLSGQELTFDYVEVGAADAAGCDPHEYLAGAGLGGRGLRQLEGPTLHWGGSAEGHGFHWRCPSPSRTPPR